MSCFNKTKAAELENELLTTHVQVQPPPLLIMLMKTNKSSDQSRPGSPHGHSHRITDEGRNVAENETEYKTDRRSALLILLFDLLFNIRVHTYSSHTNCIQICSHVGILPARRRHLFHIHFLIQHGPHQSLHIISRFERRALCLKFRLKMGIYMHNMQLFILRQRICIHNTITVKAFAIKIASALCLRASLIRM